ncbi:hypothetical protein ACQV5M_21880, partial [Leptospira sp. SA-E8]|uniref:hypothetical protein n=1 Tax=Leptospira sp. SA-E8 TaxID=3422259 RepID=UPI003EBCC230
AGSIPASGTTLQAALIARLFACVAYGQNRTGTPCVRLNVKCTDVRGFDSGLCHHTLKPAFQTGFCSFCPWPDPNRQVLQAADC